MKRHLQNERKYLQMMRLTRGLFLKYTNSSYLKNNPKGKKKGRKLNRYFSKEDMQMTKRHMKRCSTSLIIRELQIKTIVRYHLIPVRMAIIKKSTNNKCCKEDMEKKGTLLYYRWEHKLVQPL